MRRKTFEVVNGDCKATVTVRTEDGFAAIDRMHAEVALEIYNADGMLNNELPEREYFRRKQFAAAWSQSEVVGDLGFVWCESPSDNEAMQACCQAWGGQPGNIVTEWLNAVNTVDKLPNDPDLVPPNKLSAEKKTTPE